MKARPEKRDRWRDMEKNKKMDLRGRGIERERDHQNEIRRDGSASGAEMGEED